MPTILLPDPSQPKSRPGWQLPPAARYACAAIGFLIPAAWLAMAGACIRWSDWTLACEPISYGLAPLVIGAGVMGVMGLNYLDRAFRRSRKGMWQQHGGPEWGRSLQSSAKAIIWGNAEGDEAQYQITGEMRFARRRWTIRVKNGQRIHVDRRTFWLWLEQVETLAATLPAGRSPVSRRYWEGRTVDGLTIREGDLLAFWHILEAVGRFTYPRADARSRRYVAGGGAAWGAVEEFEKVMESEEY